MEMDEASLGRAIENIYPTLDDRKVLKVGEAFVDKEVEYESRKKREEEQRRARSEINASLVCPICDHTPVTWKGVMKDDSDCKCHSHSLYQEIES